MINGINSMEVFEIDRNGSNILTSLTPSDSDSAGLGLDRIGGPEIPGQLLHVSLPKGGGYTARTFGFSIADIPCENKSYPKMDRPSIRKGSHFWILKL